MVLDLGGTQNDCDVNISLDGTHIDDYYDWGPFDTIQSKQLDPTPRLAGDYFRCPFPDSSFDEARGCCVLERDDENYKAFYKEMHRILKHGGKLWVRGCGLYHANHHEHAAGTGLLLSEFASVIEDIDPDFDGTYDEGYTFINIKEVHNVGQCTNQ